MAMVEAEFGSLLELLPVPVLVTTATGCIIRANPAAVDFLDSSQALVGRYVDDVLRGLAIAVRMKLLVDAGRVMRIYALHSRAEAPPRRVSS
jgi:PAS domain-containing protein